MCSTELQSVRSNNSSGSTARPCRLLMLIERVWQPSSASLQSGSDSRMSGDLLGQLARTRPVWGGYSPWASPGKFVIARRPMRSDLTYGLLGRRPPDMVVPACQRPDDGLRANGVGAVHEDHADSEGPPVERGFLHERHHGRDAVVTAEIVVEPEFVDEAVAVLLQVLDTFAAAARDPRGPGQRPEVVYAEDDACWGG